MHKRFVRMEKLMNDRASYPIPRGEVWISSAIFKNTGMEDSLNNHFRLADQLGHDMVCLPIADTPEQNTCMGYRYFTPEELSAGLRDRSDFFAVVLDGPFQRLVGQKGLMKVLMDWAQNREATQIAYTHEQKIVLELINQCLDKGVDAIILADDLAGEKNPLINPQDLNKICTPFYRQAVSEIKKTDALTFLHCCGNLQPLLPVIQSWDLDGLAAIQISKNNLQLLDEQIGGCLITGIEASLLETDTPSPQEMGDLKRFVAHFSSQGRLILSSNCGLYKSNFRARLQNIYDELKNDLPKYL